MTNSQKIDAIKKFKSNGANDLDTLEEIRENVVLHDHQITLAPSFPYVVEVETGKFVRIPEVMYGEVLDLIKLKSNGNIVYA